MEFGLRPCFSFIQAVCKGGINYGCDGIGGYVKLNVVSIATEAETVS